MLNGEVASAVAKATTVATTSRMNAEQVGGGIAAGVGTLLTAVGMNIPGDAGAVLVAFSVLLTGFGGIFAVGKWVLDKSLSYLAAEREHREKESASERTARAHDADKLAAEVAGLRAEFALLAEQLRIGMGMHAAADQKPPSRKRQ